MQVWGFEVTGSAVFVVTVWLRLLPIIGFFVGKPIPPVITGHEFWCLMIAPGFCLTIGSWIEGSSWYMALVGLSISVVMAWWTRNDDDDPPWRKKWKRKLKSRLPKRARQRVLA